MARILVIEDDASFRETLKEILVRKDHQVITATNGEEGAVALKEHPVDLVITDIFMPVKHGVPTIQDIQKDFPTVKIIVMSGGLALSEKDYKGKTLLLDAVQSITRVKHTLAKPFSNAQLFRAIEELLCEK
jgi:YesN/AraC family two-component response regulator